MVTQPDQPLIVLVGPTASGKTGLAIHLAQTFQGEIVSCDSVAVYREMEIGTAKPTHEERTLVPHHMIDIAWPNEACTAGDYSRLARESLAGITARGTADNILITSSASTHAPATLYISAPANPRPAARHGHLPIVAGGTGLYLRALIDGLFPAPPQTPGQRERLRHIASTRGPAYLHRLLTRLDPTAASAIHPNDASKVVRAIEVSLAQTPAPSHPAQAIRTPMTKQWQQGRDALTGYRILRLGLNPPRPLLYERINQRAAAMFDLGLIEETERLLARYGPDCRPLTSLGYAEASAVLHGELTREQAVTQAQQGHRNYAKRQLTWFRREPNMHWLPGCGGDPDIIAQATTLVAQHLAR
ncbi:tRNA (adenosine(37)-N6)-dimethylallyltransferase MiaA [Granulicella sp. L60]|uniref:tRNA (adenosine(37)-N6)-dimethylallyltransferase n=1 Tax=Granulicella sp. L60 TaxID=1641866 RepID=UPI00131E89DE|nr:tRNA (adenosine(37)-N6)-dimethylallyltransferase MiaA [Granulicella sp. L60]